MTDPRDYILGLNCFLLDDEPTYAFCVRVSSTMAVSELIPEIERLYNQQHTGRTLENTIISLFKIDETIEGLANLDVPSQESRLIRINILEDYWPNPKQLDRRRIHILIKADALPMRPQQIGIDPVLQVSSALDHLTLRQDTTAEAFRAAPSASAAADHSAFEKQQEKDTIPIYNGRPYKRTDIPIQLFHPVFDVFASELKQTGELSATKYAAIEALMFGSQALYSTKPDRWRRIEGLLAAAVGHPIHKDDISQCQSGVVTFTEKDSAEKAYGIVIELKNEIGTGRSDPWIQGAQSYSRYWSQQKMNRLRRATRCPTFIISIAGPWMCVSGAVYLDHVVVQPLTDYIWLGRHPQQNHQLVRITRLFEAIYTATSFLKDQYTPFIKPDARCPILRNRSYPYIQHFQSSNGQVNFMYTRQFVGPVARPVFEATTEDQRAVVVKFTEFYNFEAHKLLAAHSLAPQLLSQHAEPVGGGLMMVVMEFSGTSLDVYLDPTGPGLESSTRTKIYNDVKRALDLLHTNNLVFGDLRSPNVLVVKANDGSLRGQLVDFEWCGTAGEARYPAGMNQSGNIRWAAGMAKGSLLSKAHDIEMLERLYLPPRVESEN